MQCLKPLEFPSAFCANLQMRFHLDGARQIEFAIQVAGNKALCQLAAHFRTPYRERYLKTAANASALAPDETLPCPEKRTRHRQSLCKTFLPSRAAPELRGIFPAVP